MFVTIQIDIHIKRTQNVHIQHLITEKHHKNKTLKTNINTQKKRVYRFSNLYTMRCFKALHWIS